MKFYLTNPKRHPLKIIIEDFVDQTIKLIFKKNLNLRAFT